MKKRFSEEQIIKILAEAEHGNESIGVPKRHQVCSGEFVATIPGGSCWTIFAEKAGAWNLGR